MSPRLSAPARRWAKRAGIALAAGLVVGVTTGLVGLRVLAGDAPPAVIAPVAPAEDAAAAPRRTYSGPRADGMRRGATRDSLSGSGLIAARESVGTVPDLIGRAEGDARGLLERAGFTLGTIMFREADEPIGTVLETFPVPGERVVLPATVNLILADRRRIIDPLFPDTTRSDSATVAMTFTLPDSTRAIPPDDTLRFLPDTLP